MSRKAVDSKKPVYFEIYRSSFIGAALRDTLDELVGSSKISQEMALRILEQFDKVLPRVSISFMPSASSSCSLAPGMLIFRSPCTIRSSKCRPISHSRGTFKPSISVIMFGRSLPKTCVLASLCVFSCSHENQLSFIPQIGEASHKNVKIVACKAPDAE
jgi:hypothetical protein